jgi:hypothetical protein
MSVTDYLLRECEVLDWWNTERLHVDEACRSALERYVDKACVAVDELSSYQLLYKSEARLHIQRKLQSDINVFNRRMELKLRKSCELSMARNERPDQFASFELRETAALMASGAAAVGAMGAAVAATGLATTATVTTVLGLFATGTIVTFSWPLFSVAAAVALSASYASPAIAGWATSKLRRRFKAYLSRMAEMALTDGNGQSARETLLASLDAARDARLAALEH